MSTALILILVVAAALLLAALSLYISIRRGGRLAQRVGMGATRMGPVRRSVNDLLDRGDAVSILDDHPDLVRRLLGDQADNPALRARFAEMEQMTPEQRQGLMEQGRLAQQQMSQSGMTVQELAALAAAASAPEPTSVKQEPIPPAHETSQPQETAAPASSGDSGTADSGGGDAGGSSGGCGGGGD